MESILDADFEEFDSCNLDKCWHKNLRWASSLMEESFDFDVVLFFRGRNAERLSFRDDRVNKPKLEFSRL